MAKYVAGNPAGEDPGHEWVELQNTSSDSVSLDGWVPRDKANHSKMLSGVVAQVRCCAFY